MVRSFQITTPSMRAANQKRERRSRDPPGLIGDNHGTIVVIRLVILNISLRESRRERGTIK